MEKEEETFNREIVAGDGDGSARDDEVNIRQLLARGLSNLGNSPIDRSALVYLELDIPNQNLTSINFIDNLIHLQKLNISGNRISGSLGSILGQLKYLKVIEARDNLLTSESLDFPAPLNLHYLDVSGNRIERMVHFERHVFLRHLCLDGNGIEKLEGLQGCKYLTHLSLRENKIALIEGLDNLPLVFLDLSFNQISEVSNLDNLSELQILDLSHNELKSLRGFPRSTNPPLPSTSSEAPSSQSSSTSSSPFPVLRSLNLAHNFLLQLESLEPLLELPLLSDLNLQGNPMLLLANVSNPLANSIGRSATSSKSSAAAAANERFSHFSNTHNNTHNNVNNGGNNGGRGGNNRNQMPASNVRIKLIHLFPRLQVLDNQPVSPEEKVTAINQFEPPEYVIQAVEHASQVIRNIKRNPVTVSLSNLNSAISSSS